MAATLRATQESLERLKQSVPELPPGLPGESEPWTVEQEVRSLIEGAVRDPLDEAIHALDLAASTTPQRVLLEWEEWCRPVGVMSS